jgi:hypothetical protein
MNFNVHLVIIGHLILDQNFLQTLSIICHLNILRFGIKAHDVILS